MPSVKAPPSSQLSDVLETLSPKHFHLALKSYVRVLLNLLRAFFFLSGSVSPLNPLKTGSVTEKKFKTDFLH